jgi:hypothetical protein
MSKNDIQTEPSSAITKPIPRKAYAKPQLSSFGTVEELTLAGGSSFSDGGRNLQSQ